MKVILRPDQSLMSQLGMNSYQVDQVRTFEDALRTNPPSFIYGAGSCATQLHGALEQAHGVDATMVVDDQFLVDARSRMQKAADVVGFREFCTIARGMSSIPLVLCGVVQPQFNFAAARDRFRSCAQAYLTHSLWNRAFLMDSQDVPLWSWEHVLQEASEYLELLDGLGDFRSRQVLLSHLRFRLIGDWRSVNEIDQPQYSGLQECIDKHAEWTLIDCGAHTGDSIGWITQAYHGVWRRILALEPDAINFDRLRRSAPVTDLVDSGVRVDLLHKGVSESGNSATFNSLGGVSSRFHDELHSNNHSNNRVMQDSVLVETVRLGDLLNDVSVGGGVFIKLDIEGDEVGVCRSVANEVEHGRVVVAASAYHSETDLVTLFRVFRDPRRRLLLRQYGYDGSDLSLVVEA